MSIEQQIMVAVARADIIALVALRVIKWLAVLVIGAALIEWMRRK